MLRRRYRPRSFLGFEMRTRGLMDSIYWMRYFLLVHVFILFVMHIDAVRGWWNNTWFVLLIFYFFLRHGF